MIDTDLEELEKALLWHSVTQPIDENLFTRISLVSSKEANRAWQLIGKLTAEGAKLSPALVASKEGAFIIGCAEVYSRHEGNIEDTIEVLIDRTAKRKLNEAIVSIDWDSLSASEVSGALNVISLESADNSNENVLVSIDDVVTVTYKRQQSLKDKGAGGFVKKTGLTGWDNLLGGLWEDNLIVIAARPSVGKTALALTMMLNMSKAGYKVAMFSLEMSDAMLLIRLASQHSGIEAEKIKKMSMTDDESASYLNTLAELSALPISISSRSTLNVLDIRSSIRSMYLGKGLDVAFVDYLQLVTPINKRSQSRERDIAEVSAGLKRIAKELHIPIVALAQLNRSIEQRGGGHAPLLSDLRESGAIEQDADIVAFINRPDRYGEVAFSDGTPTQNRAEIIVAKNRDGAVGDFKLAYYPNMTKFADVSSLDAVYFNNSKNMEW